MIARGEGERDEWSGSPPRTLTEEATQRLLLVEAVERTDGEGRLLTGAERKQASLDARAAAGGDPAGLLTHRADRLAAVLVSRVPALRQAVRPRRIPAGLAATALALAGALGLASNALGPARHINILSLPILGLLAWNAGLYVVLAALWIRGRPGLPVEHPPAGASRLASLWGRSGVFGRWARGSSPPDPPQAHAVAVALEAYVRSAWARLGPAWTARVRALLHLAAAALGAGVLAGMYLRGIAFEYQATWESTFLGPEALSVLLRAVLGPASLVLGEPLPGPEALGAIRAPASGDAAPWIHRYALTTLGLVILPRVALAAAATWRAHRVAGRLTVALDTPYARRLLAPERGGAVHLDVTPYSYRLAPRRADVLMATLRAFAGHRAAIRLRAPVEYGADPAELLAEDESPSPAGTHGVERWVAVVFALAQTPEPEVHGDVLGALRDWVARDPGVRRLLVLVDGSGYREGLADATATPARVAERRRAWDRVARDLGLPVAHLDLAGPGPDDLDAAGIEQGCWPELRAEASP